MVYFLNHVCTQNGSSYSNVNFRFCPDGFGLARTRVRQWRPSSRQPTTTRPAKTTGDEKMGAPRRAAPRGEPSPASKAWMVPSTAPTTATRAW